MAKHVRFVGEMSLKGIMVRKFDLRLIESIELFYWSPVYLAVDENNDIFVADVLSNRILLLNSQLNDCRVIDSRFNRVQRRTVCSTSTGSTMETVLCV